MSLKQENAQRRILAVDDDPQSTRILEAALKSEGYQFAAAASGEAGIAKILSWHPHLVLLDVNMPDFDGLQTLRFLRQSPDYIAAMFVSGRSSVDDVVMGLDAGADDYITKPFDVSELLARIRCQLRIKDIRDELNRANAQLLDMVDHDELTGLYNMRAFYRELDREILRAQRYRRQLGVLMMDMDHFKSVNDDNDHLFGSFVLQEMGHIIQDNIRSVDFAARYGGDEFVIVLTEISEDGAQIFADRLLKLISEHDFRNDKHQKKLTASIGLAVTNRDNAVDSRGLVRTADRALYKAKDKGRNCVVAEKV